MRRKKTVLSTLPRPITAGQAQHECERTRSSCHRVSRSPDDVRVRIRFIRDANLPERGYESLWRSIKQCSPPDGSRLPRQQLLPNSLSYRSAFRQEVENGEQGWAKIRSLAILRELVQRDLPVTKD